MVAKSSWQHPEGPGSDLEGPRKTSPSSTSATTTPSPMPNGPANVCRRKPNSSSPPGEDSTASPTVGVMRSCRMASRWLTPGRANSHFAIPWRTAISRPHRLPLSPRTATGYTTCLAMFGNGAATGINPNMWEPRPDAIRKGPPRVTIRMNRVWRTRSARAVPFSAARITASASRWPGAGKANPKVAAITLAFDASSNVPHGRKVSITWELS